MRKKLVSLGIALAALVAASTLAPATASAGTACPNGYHLITCPTYSFCCPNNAFCVCSPFN